MSNGFIGYIQAGESWTFKPWVPAWARQAYCRLPYWWTLPAKLSLRPVTWALRCALMDEAHLLWPPVEPSVTVTTFPACEEPDWFTAETVPCGDNEETP